MSCLLMHLVSAVMSYLLLLLLHAAAVLSYQIMIGLDSKIEIKPRRFIFSM